MVSIPGGEPLMHPEIAEIVQGLVARKKYIYLCTNALLLKEKIGLFKPSKYLTFSVHLDGQREHHDLSVCREGGYDQAVAGIREAVARGFRVTTNTTLFDGAETFFRSEIGLQDVGGVLDFAASGAGEVAAEQGLEHEHERVLLASGELLAQDVGRNGPHL